MTIAARRALAIALVASLSAMALGCGWIVGLHDHELAPDALPDGGAAGEDDGGGDDGGGVGVTGDGGVRACGPGYARIDGRCGDDVVEVAAAGTHACVVLRAGELWCWGKNQHGELGVAPATTSDRCGGVACRAMPARVPALSGVAHVALGDDYTCALLTDGSLLCFGDDARGLLGHDGNGDPRCPRDGTSNAQQDPCTWTPTRVGFPPKTAIAEVSAGSDVACARTTTGDVFCWGDNTLGGVGKAPPTANQIIPMPFHVAAITGDATAIAVSGTFGHVCALRTLGTVWCWGANIEGELGHPRGAGSGDNTCVFYTSCTATVEQAQGINATALSLGQEVSCGRRTDGTVACWGGNEDAQLGNGASVDNQPHPTPAAVSGLSAVVAIEERFLTGFAIDGDAHVWTWGLASDGATAGVGAGITCANGSCVPKPTPIPALDGAVQIAATSGGGVALKSDGSVWTWGLNDVAQLGHLPGTGGDSGCRDGACRATPAVLPGLP